MIIYLIGVSNWRFYGWASTRRKRCNCL